MSSLRSDADIDKQQYGSLLIEDVPATRSGNVGCFETKQSRFVSLFVVNVLLLSAVIVAVVFYVVSLYKPLIANVPADTSTGGFSSSAGDAWSSAMSASSGASSSAGTVSSSISSSVSSSPAATCSSTPGINSLNATVNGTNTNQSYAPLVSFYGNPTAVPDSLPCNLTIGFIADTFLQNATAQAYQLLLAEGAEMTVISGDLNYDIYDRTPLGPPAWEDLVNQYFGPNYPLIVGAGNHDSEFWDLYAQRIAARFNRSGLSTCTGLVGILQTCTYKGLTIITTAPGVFNTSSESRNFSSIVNRDGPVKFDVYIEQQLALFPSPWKICSWHKNQRSMQTGTKTDETGWDVYQTCLRNGAMIMTGHEHTYSRTYLMKSLGPGLQGTQSGNTMQMDGSGRPISSPLTLQPTTPTVNAASFVVVQGMGGRTVREAQNPNIYWAAQSNLYNGAAASAVTICKYNYNGNPLQAYCYTKDILMRVLDEWIIETNSS